MGSGISREGRQRRKAGGLRSKGRTGHREGISDQRGRDQGGKLVESGKGRTGSKVGIS